MQTPTIEVGILSAEAIRFRLNGTFLQTDTGTSISNQEGQATATNENTFTLHINGKEYTYNDAVVFEPNKEDTDNFDLYDVIIGVQFHWERAENQRFRGKLKLYADNGKLTAVNILSLEEYLLSVISSEMSSTSSDELLKAHAVISRSWLLAQLEKSKQVKSAGYTPIIKNEDGYIRWYDREDHDRFDVCADDHCQRYQGITMVSSEQVYKALQFTRGEVLTYNNKVCDARFYKCCGGITELFENVWEPVHHPYLVKVIDNPAAPAGYKMDLSIEENAARWILAKPEAFCNTDDKAVLSQMLNNYDQETPDFYRWETTLTQAEIKDLLFKKVGIDVGDVLDLLPIERGVSGRIIRLKIVGSKKSITIGKELEIRKALSKSHLYSSAFVVEKKMPAEKENHVPEEFVLKGAGWGHGVGLCQIGAAVMSTKGYSYQEILTHYFPSSKLEKIY